MENVRGGRKRPEPAVGARDAMHGHTSRPKKATPKTVREPDSLCNRLVSTFRPKPTDGADVERAERAETHPKRLITVGDYDPCMAVRHQSASERATTKDDTDEEDEETIDLRDDLGLDVPPGASSVQIHRNGRPTSFELVIERRNKWVIEGANHWGEITGVYADGHSVSLPRRVPNWLEQVCRRCDVTELAI